MATDERVVVSFGDFTRSVVGETGPEDIVETVLVRMLDSTRNEFEWPKADESDLEGEEKTGKNGTFNYARYGTLHGKKVRIRMLTERPSGGREEKEIQIPRYVTNYWMKSQFQQGGPRDITAKADGFFSERGQFVPIAIPEGNGGGGAG